MVTYFFSTFLLPNLNENIVFCECSFVVVRHFVCCECFGSYRTDVSCCTNGTCLISHIQTGRCGRICFFALLFPVANVECKHRVCECSLVRCDILHDVDVVAVVEWPGFVFLLMWVQ